MSKKITLKGITWVFVFFFLVVSTMNLMPFLRFENGKILGFFELEPIADYLHIASGIWALFAVLYSRGAMVFYYRVFGTLYFLDGVAGIIFGKAYLNLRLFHSHEEAIGDFMMRLILNAPHVLIGGTAMFIGFYLQKKIK